MPATLVKPMTRILAAALAASLLLAPAAQAERGHKRGHGDHGGYDRGGSHGGNYGHSRRKSDSYGHRSHKSYSYGHDRHDYGYSKKHYKKHYKHYDDYRPRYSYGHGHKHRSGYSYGYSYPSSSVTITYGSSYGPYYYSGYRPRYDVGHYYAYGPRSTVYISDYSNYGLYEPPHGYHWVRDHDRGDAILASVATGAIIGLVIGAIATD
jgi:Ni/Co efflux regulator RcnB